MAIEFPANPAAQTPANTFSPTSTPLASPNDVTYTWDGVKWEAYKKLDPSDFDDLFVEVAGDDMTGNLTLGTDNIVLDAGDGSGTFAGSGNFAKTTTIGEFDETSATAIGTRIGVYSGNSAVQTKISIAAAGSTGAYEVIAGTTRTIQFSGNGIANFGGDLVDPTAYKPNIKLNGPLGSGVFVGDIQSTSQNGGQLGFRNQIINGGFHVFQRGTSTIATNVANTFVADRWILNNNSGSNTTVTQNDDPSSPTGSGLAIFNASGFLYTPLELDLASRQGRFTGAYTFSFYSTQPVNDVNCEYRDTATSSTNRVVLTVPPLVATGVTSGAWIQYSTTIDFDQAVPNLDNICLIIGVKFNSGVTTAFTAFQLEPGPVATPFEHRPISTELAMCQRYYYTSYDGSYPLDGSVSTIYNLVIAGAATPNSSAAVFEVGTIHFPVQMRVTPTIKVIAPDGTLNEYYASPGNVTVRGLYPTKDRTLVMTNGAGTLLSGVVSANAEM